MSVSSPAPLAAGYLLRNFRQVAQWVNHLYADLLTTAEQDCFAQFHRMPDPAQSLYLRLVTRTRPVVPVASLHYDEIPDTDAALRALLDSGFAVLNPPLEPSTLLALQTRSDLQTWFGNAGKTAGKKSALTESIQAQFTAEQIHNMITTQQPLVMALQRDWFELVLLLFFGNGRQDLSEFVITELGHVRYENYRVDRSTRYFSCRGDIETLQAYLLAREQLEDPDVLQDPQQLQHLFTQLPHHRQQPELQRRFDKLAVTIARQLERLDALDAALHIYRATELHPSGERQARILAKQDQLDEALSLCHQLQHSPHPEAQEFAEQFSAQLLRKRRQPVIKPAAPDIITNEMLLPPQDMAVEYLAAAALTRDESPCYYVENTLFCGLFGLLFWDIIFAPVPGAFFHPFQHSPKHLRSEYFYADRAASIEQRLHDMEHTSWQSRLWDIWSSRQGVANPFVVWEVLTADVLERALAAIPVAHLQCIFRQLAQHPGLYSNGFPDLIHFVDDGYQLIEVKAPNDRLQPNQRRWFRRFADAGIPARLLNIRWQETNDD